MGVSHIFLLLFDKSYSKEIVFSSRNLSERIRKCSSAMAFVWFRVMGINFQVNIPVALNHKINSPIYFVLFKVCLEKSISVVGVDCFSFNKDKFEKCLKTTLKRCLLRLSSVHVFITNYAHFCTKF